MNRSRSLQPILLGFGLIICLISSCALIFQNPVSFDPSLQTLLKNSKRVLAYEVSNHQKAIFKVLPQDAKLEIVSNLNIPRSESETGVNPYQSPDYNYALEILLTDSDGTPVQREDFFEKTRYVSWHDSGMNARTTTAFYLDSDFDPCDSRLTTVRLPQNRNGEMYLVVCLREPVDGTASIRLYRHLDKSEGADVGSIKPMGHSLRNKLSRNNLFGPRARDVEIKRFLRDIWEQLPAEGRNEADYLTRDIFLPDGIQPIWGLTPPPSGYSIDKYHPLSLNIRDLKELRVTSTGDQEVELFLYGTHNPVEHRVLRLSKNQPLVVGIEDGYSVAGFRSMSETPVNLIFDPDIDEMTGKTVYYGVLPDSGSFPVHFSIPHKGNGSRTPIKIICRFPLGYDADPAPESALLLCRCYHEDGSIQLIKYNIDVPEFSQYARYLNSEPTLVPSIPSRLFLMPPEGSVRVDLLSSMPLDVALFTTPETLFNSEHDMSVPSEHAFLDGCDDLIPTPPLSRTWHYFRPDNWEKLKVSGRMTPLSLPEGFFDSPVSSDDGGTLEFESVSPSPLDRKLAVYEPVDAEEASVQHSRALYGIFEPAISYHLFISPDMDPMQTYPVQYRCSLKSGAVLQVWIDGKNLLSFRPLSSEGRFLLPAMAPGNHTISITSVENSDVFYMRIPRGMETDIPRYFVRYVQQLNPGDSLTIPFEKRKTGRETLNIVLYSERSDIVDDVSISLETEPWTAEGFIAADLTSPAKHVRNIPIREYPGSLLSMNRAVHSTHSIPFTLHDDLPPGKYHIQIRSTLKDLLFIRSFRAVS